MIARRDYRDGTVYLTMTDEEFHQTVEWLEVVAPEDRATADWRRELDHQYPPRDESVVT